MRSSILLPAICSASCAFATAQAPEGWNDLGLTTWQVIHRGMVDDFREPWRVESQPGVPAVSHGRTIDSEVVTRLIDDLVETDAEGMQMLNRGEVQAFASDQVVLIGQIIQSGNPGDYALSQDLYSFEPYALMMRRDDAAFRLVANRALAHIYRSGQFKQLFERWFGKVGLRPSPVLAAMYQLEAIPE